MSSNQPRVWTHDDLEPGPNPDGNFPKVMDKFGVRWCADEREDGFEGWRSDSHGFRQWRIWFNLAFERGPLNEVTPQASSAERSQEDVCRCAPTPSALGPLQWAVIKQGDGCLFPSEETARSVQWMRLDDFEGDFRVYEVREVPDA